MTLRHVLMSGLIAALAAWGTSSGWDTTALAEDKPSDAETHGEVLTRGPIHEAFAETITFDPQPGLIAPKAPPAAIEELPPDQKPAGENVAWIPGYWAWDDDRSDFLWVSGIWRSLPPGRQWLPGYWGKSSDGDQWTSGYWADAEQSDVRYLPEPPTTVESGPNVEAPSSDHIWIPGCWVWNENRYAWRPGYWVAPQQNWVWTPAHYQWSPRGYVFVDGYYDYSIARRGVVFAPVYFAPSVYAQQGFSYSPTLAVNLAVFSNQLFLRPNYGHYYFGDYYGSGGATAGYYPWFAFNSGGHGYDPFYAQQRWQNRQDPMWVKMVQTNFQNRVDHEDARPPQTFAAQQALVKDGSPAPDKSFAAVAPLDQLVKGKESGLKLLKVTKDEQQQLAKQGIAFRQFGGERQKFEAQSKEEPAKGTDPIATKFTASPILAKTPMNAASDHTPPKAHVTPKTDPQIEPKSKRTAAKVEVPQEKPIRNAIDSKPKPKSPTQVGPKTVPQTQSPKPDQPKPVTPKVDLKPAPKIEQKPSPTPAPKPEAKPQPRTTPKSEAPKASGNEKPGVKPKAQPQ